MGLREGSEVADGPSHNVAVAVEVAFSAGGGAEDFGDVPGDRGLLGEYCDCSGFAGLVLQ